MVTQYTEKKERSLESRMAELENRVAQLEQENFNIRMELERYKTIATF